MMIEILLTLVIILIILICIGIYIKKNEQQTINKDNIDLQRQTRTINDLDNLEGGQNTFDKIIQLLREEFQPTAITSEDDCETQLIHFLSSRFPSIVQSKGHTVHGRKIDLVIEGVYALELILVTNEGKLLSLMEQIGDSKQEFSKMAVILVDVNEVPSDKIQQYSQEYENLGVMTIVKKAY